MSNYSGYQIAVLLVALQHAPEWAVFVAQFGLVGMLVWHAWHNT